MALGLSRKKESIMMSKKKKLTNELKKTRFLTIVLSLFSILALPMVIFAIGQVTEPIIVENALRGGEFEETLNIINTQKEEIEVGLSTSGEIAGWAKFYKPQDLKNPIEAIGISANERTDIIVIFGVPKETPNGTYKGFVGVTQKPKTSDAKQGSSVSVAQKIDREVTITVSGKEIISVKTSIIPQKYDLAKDEALKIRVIYDNQGNISITPELQIKIKKESQVVYSAIYPYLDTEPAVRPSSIYEVPGFEIPTTGWQEGKYIAEIAIFQAGQKVSENSFRFSVGMVSAISQEVAGLKQMASIGTIIAGLKINWFIVGISLGIIFLLLTTIFLRKFPELKSFLPNKKR